MNELQKMQSNWLKDGADFKTVKWVIQKIRFLYNQEIGRKLMIANGFIKK